MRILITGASRGLGEALARLVPRHGDDVFLVSRTRPATLDVAGDGVACHWIPADLSEPNVAEKIASKVTGVLDVRIHNAAVWESNAFSSGYDFEAVPEAETRRIIDVNTTAPITLTRALLPHLRRSENPKVILIGSVNDLPNTRFPEVAYGAIKWGLRGVAHTLREALRPDRIGVTIIHPGTIGDAVHNRQGVLVGEGIPFSDMGGIVRCVIETSRRAVIKEITVPAMLDTEV